MAHKIVMSFIDKTFFIAKVIMRLCYKLIILVFTLVSIYASLIYLEQRRLAKTRRLLQSSIGTLDRNAKQALDLLESAKKTKEVHFNIARIVDLNMGDTNAPEVVENYYQVMNANPDLFQIEQMEYFNRRREDEELDLVFIDTLERSRRDYLEDILKKAKTGSDNKLDAFSQFAESAKTNTSDSQNTHDASVNVQSRHVLENLGDTEYSHIQEIQNLVNSQPQERKFKMNRALDKIKNDDYNSTFSSSEMKILNKVWERSHVVENKDNKQNLQDAILYSLYDMTDDDGGTVCSSGRMTRLIDSLAFIDNEDVFNGYMTTEQIRNEVVQHSSGLLQETINENIEYKTDLENIAKSYTDPTILFSQDDEKLFKDIVKSKIVDDMEKFKEKLSEVDYSKIQNFCLEAVDSI